jgi:hypothetical protein
LRKSSKDETKLPGKQGKVYHRRHTEKTRIISHIILVSMKNIHITLLPWYKIIFLLKSDVIINARILMRIKENFNEKHEYFL